MAGFRAGQVLTADLLNSLIIDKAEVPTNEDLMLIWTLSEDSAIAATRDDMIAVMPFDTTILSCNLVFDDATVTASDTDYWQVDLIKKGLDGTSTTTLATRTTQVTGDNANGGISIQKNWSFDGATWNSRLVNAGEVLGLLFTKTGAPTTLGAYVSATIRYQRATA